MGYVNDEEETQRVFDEDGWLLSGDLGYKDAKGFLFITGRLKGKTLGTSLIRLV